MLTVTVQNLAALVGKNGENCASLALFLNGFPIEGVAPSRCDPDDGHVGFLLSRNDANSLAWNHLLGRPSAFSEPVTVAVGPSTTRSIPQALNGRNGTEVILTLHVLPKAEFFVFGLIAISVLVALVMLGMRTAMLREPGGDRARPARGRPFSLGRTQQAFWVALVVLAYVFVYLVTDNLNTLSNSSLLLIAISTGTAIGGQLMMSGKDSTVRDDLSRLEVQRDDVAANVEKLTAAGSDQTQIDTAAAALAKLDAQIATTKATLARGESKGFLADLLYDEDGVSLQRLQIVVWTVVLGCIFVNEVYDHLTMPEFSATLLTLMGLSSGTYLVGKSNELANVQPAGAAAPDTSATVAETERSEQPRPQASSTT